MARSVFKLFSHQNGIAEPKPSAEKRWMLTDLSYVNRTGQIREYTTVFSFKRGKLEHFPK
jgi:hypothetical protein